MTVQQFRLPDAGEGLTEADIVTWRVRVGDVVAVNDPLVEIETAKSLVELPCPFAGVVRELLAAEGDTVAVGSPIVAVEVGASAASSGSASSGSVSPDPVASDRAAGGPAAPGREVSPSSPVPERTPVLVGYGPRTGGPTRRRRLPPESPAHPAPAATLVRPVTLTHSGEVRPLAKPPVRRLARDLGVDLRTVIATGPRGVVTRTDVEQAAGSRTVEPEVGPGGAPVRAAVTPDGSRGETRVPVKGVRRATAAAMVASAFTAPHVTEWVQADVTRTMKLLARLKADARFSGLSVTPTLLVARALLLAVRRFPEINATWDDAAGEIVRKHYVDLGVATATDRGLLVPVVRDADRLDLPGLAAGVGAAVAAAREGRSTPAELAGGTITITNVGVFGVDGGTPILPPGQAAILAVGRIAPLPWVHRGKVRPRQVTTLSLSFDHRLVDGDLGSRVLAATAALLTDPAEAILY